MTIEDSIKLLQVCDSMITQLALSGDTDIMLARENVLRAIELLEDVRQQKWSDKWGVTTGDPLAGR